MTPSSKTMPLPKTEDRDPLSIGLSKKSDEDVLAVLLQRQKDAVNATEKAIPALAQAAAALQNVTQNGGKVGYSGAGSSGLTALTDCLELPGTFGYPAERIRMLFAGGVQNLLRLAGTFEDLEDAGYRDFQDSDLGTGDILIAVSASGSTPYTLGTARAAKQAGTEIVALANNPDTPLLQLADHPVFLETPPEIVAGSTRLGAASAQKAALNMISTLVALRLGHAVRGHMVNLVADNEKLRLRAQRILQDLTGCEAEIAAATLSRAEGRVKVAALMIREGLDADGAEKILTENGGNLRPFL
ncbi:N-acetylmuramic acid 6-phosphate etherase [Roseibium sp. M-1]